MASPTSHVPSAASPEPGGLARAAAALRQRRVALIRYTLITALVVGALAWTFGSIYLAGLQVCESIVSDRHAERTCHAIGAVQLAPFAVAIVLLLFPELAEASVAGVMSIKRRGGGEDA
jgi:hypothetical protein